MLIRKMTAFLLTVFIVMATTIGLAQEPPPPDYFPLQVGDWWKYQSTTADNQKIEFTIKVLNTENLNDGTTTYKTETLSTVPIHEWYSKPNGWVLWHREAYPSNNQSVDFQPIRQYLKNPMAVGDTWQWEGKGLFGIDIKESNQVAAPEEVMVPAGKFQAMKVVTDVVQGGAAIKKTLWYANQVGFVKGVTEGSSFKSTTELIDYSFKPSNR